MQFDEAGLLKADVMWYRADDGALPIEGGTLFNSSNWDSIPRSRPGLGEQWDSDFRWYNGDNPFGFGGLKRPCGPLRWWHEGCPSNAPRLLVDGGGAPLCCGPAQSVNATSGLQIGVYRVLCQPWKNYNAPAPYFKRLSTGEVWTTTLNTNAEYNASGVAFPLDRFSVTNGGLPNCQGYTESAGDAFIEVNPGFHTYDLTLVSYNPATQIGYWNVPTSATRYAGETFAFYRGL